MANTRYYSLNAHPYRVGLRGICLHIYFVYFVFVSVLFLYLLWFVMCNGRLMLESSASPPWIPSLLPSTTSPSARHFHYHHQHYVRVSSTYTHHSACTQQTTIANIPSIPIERGTNIVTHYLFDHHRHSPQCQRKRVYRLWFNMRPVLNARSSRRVLCNGVGSCDEYMYVCKLVKS